MDPRYYDVEIEIDRCCCGEQEIRILESSFDRPRARFLLDAERREALETKVQEFGGLLLLEGKENAARRRELAEALGMELYKVLLPDPIRRTFERSRDTAQVAGKGVRLRLSFGRPGAGEQSPGSFDFQLSSLPWELLCNPETRTFVGKSPGTPIVRYLDLGERIKPLEVTPPLRVLGVIPSPDPQKSKRLRYSKIDVERHQRILKEAITKQATYLQVRFPDDGTLPTLHNELDDAKKQERPYHAVHFLGHGGFNDEGEGVLLFERSDSSEHNEHMVTGRDLAEQLTDDVRLVVLASCDAGQIPLPRQNGEHPFAGVASALVAAGKPAVVAMQFRVSEAAAAAFTQAFYEAIDADKPIDEAITEGRLAIGAHGGEGHLEWGTPVLFLRSPDGRVLRLGEEPPKPPKTVAVFNVLDLNKERMKHVDVLVDLRRYFDRRWIRERADWNGAVMDELRKALRDRVPPESPVHFELAAPLSVAFACGFLLSAKDPRTITVRQKDATWSFDSEPPLYAAPWIDDAAARSRVPGDFPFDQDASDIAAVVGVSRTALRDVAAYLKRRDLDSAIPFHPPRIRELIYACFEDPDQSAIKDGGHARRLAARLMERISDAARSRDNATTHLFLAGPHGLALALGRESHMLPRIQLYEFDFEGKHHGTYEPSITLEPPEMGKAP